ncbi:hypothetical protein AB0420_02325 [Streptomyces caelestis]|uniref:hypothetical protein n=1 Tax=Streptomyces caelestis TaxID=36816 RepID=UPI00344B52F8
MRVRLTDGQYEIELDTDPPADTDTPHPRRTPGRHNTPPPTTPTLPEIEATLGRLLDHLRRTPDRRQPFGFTGRDLDGVSLDSNTERAEPHDDGRGDEYEDDEP